MLFGVTLDSPTGETNDMAFDSVTVDSFQDIEKLNKKDHVFVLLDAFLAKNKMQAIFNKTTTPNPMKIGRQT